MSTNIAELLENKYYRNHKNQTRDTTLSICINDREMSKIVSQDKPVTLVIDKDCYCYNENIGFLPREETTRIQVPYNEKPITVQMCCEYIVNSDWLCCNHCFLEGFTKPTATGDVCVFLGS